MTLFAVTRTAGPAWAAGGIPAQPAVDEHAGYMNALADDGLVLLAGPLAGTEGGRIRVLLIAEAEDPAEIESRLAADPWEVSGQIVTARIEPWTVFIGGQRLPAGAGSGRR